MDCVYKSDCKLKEKEKCRLLIGKIDFDEIFEASPDQWRLMGVYRKDTKSNRKLLAQRDMQWTGYARFHCSKCSNTWASAKSMAIFYYPRQGETLGLVRMRLFGQQCRRCSRTNGHYVDPDFDEDAIELVVKRLYERIGWFCYNKPRPRKKEIDTHRPNEIQGPHEKSLCEACLLGHCNQT